jgi:DNA recombination protein RmuC
VVGLILGWSVGWGRARSQAAVAAADAETKLALAMADRQLQQARLESTVEQERQAASARAREYEDRLREVQARASNLENEHQRVLEDLSSVRETNARLETQLASDRQAFEDRLTAVRDAEERLTRAFGLLSAEALDASTRRFLELAVSRFENLKSDAARDLAVRQAEIAGIVSPMKEALQKVEQTLATVEQARSEDKGRLTAELGNVATAHQALQDETRKLTRALQVPHVRGRWGEMQLRRVVELAGMEEHCDFNLQQSLAGDDGVLRPDLVVTLPGGRAVVVDAKAPVVAYLEAVNLPDEAARDARMRDHASLVKAHINALGAKSYWDRLETAPDFVVLFLPGESFFSAAVQHDPGLFEHGVRQRVFLAGPFTLLALLRTVAHGWNREKLAENAKAISDLGRELYDRLVVMTDHFVELRRKLQGAVEAHNAAVGSLESRVLPSARRFRDLGITAQKELEHLSPVEQTPRRIQAADMGLPGGQPACDAELLDEAHDGALEPRPED